MALGRSAFARNSLITSWPGEGGTIARTVPPSSHMPGGTTVGQLLLAAPGVGVSLGGVAPDEVWRAIRVVWAGSVAPLVAIYARGGQLDDVTSPGVIVQREIAGERLTVYTRAPGRPGDDEVWLAAAATCVIVA